MIFVDTDVWFSLVVSKDSNHAKSSAWFSSLREPLGHYLRTFLRDRNALALSSTALRTYQLHPFRIAVPADWIPARLFTDLDMRCIRSDLLGEAGRGAEETNTVTALPGSRSK